MFNHNCVTATFINALLCPPFDDNEAVEPDAVSEETWDAFCTAVVDGPPDIMVARAELFAEPLIIGGAVFSFMHRTPRLAALVAFGARQCSRLQHVSDRSRGRAPSQSFIAEEFLGEPRGGDWPTRDAFRRSEIVLNHLVARYYGLGADDYRQCAAHLLADSRRRAQTK
jgi:hypothetical protein